MKKIITILILFSVAVCTLDECKSEKDSTKCQTHEIEYDGFSCYTFNYEGSEVKGCGGYPNDKDIQKIYFKFFNGIDKEISSKEIKTVQYEEPPETSYYYSKSETFEEGEEVVLQEKLLTDEEQKIKDKGNTCSYLYYGRFLDQYVEANPKSGFLKYTDIEDKNVCFNADQFPELKDLIDCGYAEINYTVDGKEYKLKTCFYIPNDNMPKDLQTFFKTNKIDPLFEEDEPFQKMAEYMEASEEGSRRLSKTRKLEGTNYEIIVENKEGKKVKYSEGSDTIEEIEEEEEGEESDSSTPLIIGAICICALILLFIICAKFNI